MESEEHNSPRIAIAITGASGSIYAEYLTKELLNKVERIYLVFSPSGEEVVHHECKDPVGEGSILLRALSKKLTKDELKVLRVFKANDLFAPIASGTSAPTSMVVVPCSMGTLGRIAGGISSNLIERCADVMLKQRRQLIICPRETPFNLIHLRNMTTLVEAGAEMLPLMPGFYQNPKTTDDLVNFCVGKIMEQLKIHHSLYRPWNSRMR